MTLDKTLYISLKPLKFENKHAFFSVSFKTPYNNCLILPTLE